MNTKSEYTSKTINYYIILFASVLDMVGIIAFGALFLFSSLNNSTTNLPSFVETQTFGFYSIPAFVWLVLCAICGLLYPYLTMKRQALRDDVEYDEFGVNRKRGNFSQLSKKEREEIERQKMIDAERILDAPTLKKITKTGSTDPEADLAKLIGLNNVKADIKQMEARMIYEQSLRADQKKKKKKGERQTDTLSSMHMIFKGEPGTGKTTIARIMAGLLYKYGYIKKNQCIEIDGNFFNGLSVGESSKRVSMLIQKSFGSVIFIDEAYALLSSGGGQEVIATIVKAMEDYRDEIIFIFAGYENEMKDFINSNPGIESRVKYHMQFHNYSTSDLKRIFKAMANEKNLLVSQELLEAFAIEMKRLERMPNYGNARTVRNLLDKIIDKHALNMVNGVITEEDKYHLKACDMPDPN